MTEEYSPVSVNRDVGTEQPSLWIHSSEEPSSTEREHKRITHNNSEKQRKEKIKSKIANIGHLLPAVRCYEKQSTLSILERAADYISEIQDKNDQLMYHNGDEVQAEEIQSLRQKLDDLKSERDRFADLLKTAGISTLLNATNSWKGKKANCTSSTSDCRPESADTTSNIPHLSANNSNKDNDQEGSTKSTKSKRRNTICAQLERIQNKNVTDKATTALKMNTGNIIIPGLNNLNGMQTANVLPTNINQQQLFAAAPNLLASTLSNAILASNGHGHVIFSNANSAGGVVSIQAPTNQPGVTFVSPSPNLLAGTDKGNGDGAGLLQIAMRDAGITTVTQSFLTQPSAQVPQITNQSAPAMIGSITSTNTEAVTSADSSQVPHSTPLQTLASIASNTQSINTGLIGSSFLGGTSCFQQGSTTMTNTTQAINSQVPIMSVGQTNYGQILQNGNTLINVPIINANGQALPIGGALSGLTGIQGLQTQQGQIVLVNDHSGVSLMPNLQMVVDPAALALSNSTRQFTTPDKLAVTNKIDQSKMAFTGMMANPCDMINHTTTIPVQNQQQQQQSIFQNAINAQALASNPAAAAAAMQQLTYQPPQHTLSLGAANTILQQPQQLGATAAATTTTTHQQQQQPILPTPFAGQSANFLNPNPGLVLPVSQNGNLLTLNTVPSQPNQLPTALILPNGHIIPVVTQPQVLLQQQLQQQQLQQQQLQQQLLNANCQLQTAAHPQTMHPSQLQTKVAVIGGLSNGTLPVIDSNLTTVLNSQNLQCQNQNAMLLSQQRAPVGLLMTTTISSFPMSNAATTVASMNNNMVTTSATQSVMTTQVQSSQTHRPTSAPAFIKRSDTQTSDSKGVVMSTTSVQPQVQLKVPSTSASESSVLLGNMSQANSLATVGTVPSQNDTSAVISSTLQPNINASLPLNQQTQGAGSNGTILITFGPPGQQSCCILNSNTMQGIGNIANSQPVLTTTASASISTTTQSSSKKCNKKNSQRTIMPKPPKSNNSNTLGSVSSMNSSNSVSSTQVVSSGLWNSVSLNTDQEASSTSIQSVVSANEVCVTTSAESTITQSPSTSHTSDNTGTTDILAKAAESIFSSSLHDISPPISSFYNPANEDNPLHIDTSAGETEDDCSAQSPSKESCDSDNIPTSSRIEMEVESQSSHSLDNTCNSLTVTSNSASAFFKETDMCEAVGAISKRGRSKPEKDKLKTTSKESKKLVNTKKIVKKPISMEISEAINFATTEFSEVLDHVEAVAIEKRKVKSVAKDTAKRATLKVPAKKPAQSVDIPDEIVFTESEISDVLDQVENLRNTCWGSETDPKKMKNRKVKSSCPEPDSEQPPSKKKKRVGKDYDSLLDGEAVKMNSSDCDNPISIEENPSELLSPDSTTVTKNVSNYTPSSTDESPTGSGGDSICEKGVSYDPYDITLTLDEPESIKTFRSVDPSKSLCESNSHISDSYSTKIAERAQSAAEEITCTTSIQVTNSRASSRMIVTSPSTANSNVDNDNTGENNQIKMNGIVEPKQLHLHCDSQPTSNAADDMLSKNTCSNQQMSTTSQTSSVNNLSSSQPQHPPCNLQSQQISTPNASLPSSVNSISTSVDPTEGNCVNSSAQMAPPCTTEHNSYSSPNSLRYSAESLFNPSNKLTTQSKSQLQSQAQIIIPHHTSNITNSIGGEALSTTATLSTVAPVSSSKSRNSGIYSAENFVQSGRNDTSRSDNKHSYSSAVFSSTNNTVHHLSTSESDSLSFSNLGLSLTPTSSSSSSSNTYSESSSCNTSTSFTFSLTNSNNNSIFPSHQFPFLHLHSLVTSQHLHNDNTDSVNSNQQSQTFGLPSFGLNNQRNNSEAETSVPQNTPSGQIIVSGSSTTANHLQPHNTFNFGLGSSIENCSSSTSRNQTFQDGSSLSLNSSGIDKSSSNSNVLSPPENNRDNSNPKHLPNVAQSISLSNRPQQPSLNTVDCSAQITSSVSTYFAPMNYQSLHTPPLHHPPVTSSESARANISRSFNTNLSTPMTNFGSSTPVFNGRFDSNQLFSSQRDGASQNMNLNSDSTKSAPHQISKVSKQQQQSTAQHSLPQPQTQPTIGSLSSHQPIHSSSASSSSSSISTSPQVPNLGASQQQQQQQQQQQPPIQQQPQQPTPQQQQQQQRSAKQNSRAKQSQSKKNKQSFSDVDSNLSQSIFEPNMALYFSITNSSPPPPPPPPPSSSRTIQSDTPSFMSGNLFTSSARQISNTSSTVLKNSDISTSFNTIFPPSRSQNGIGLNFQTGFGMNTVHSGHSNTPQIPPHSSSMPNLPHVSSLSLSNIFPDVSTSQSEALNISPIKFHTNSILPPPQAGMDPNALQHHHQSGALYHNRGHPPPPVIHNMSINSILGHNPHSFEARGPVAQAINSTVAPGFHGPSHSTFPMPPLNFSMHEH